MDINKYKQCAFTLAEVLITLGIIGVVAAMTIPTLMNKTQDQEFKVAYKKAYSEINQTITLLKDDNGGTLVGLFQNQDAVADLFSAKMRTINVCHTADGTCYDGHKISITLADGAILSTWSVDPNCNNDSWGKTNFGQNMCTEFYIDVNGIKKPNQAGKDQFWVGVGPDKVIPAGVDGMINANYKCPDGVFCNSFKYLYE